MGHESADQGRLDGVTRLRGTGPRSRRCRVGRLPLIGWGAPAPLTTATGRSRCRWPGLCTTPGLTSPSSDHASCAPATPPVGPETNTCSSSWPCRTSPPSTSSGCRTVITQCPHCFNTLANEYPQLGGTYEVIHHSQLLAELMRRGLVPMPDGGDGAITYHDPCYLGRHNDVYLPPREVAASGAAGSLVEMPRSGNRAMCCGAGWRPILDGGAHREEGQRGAGGGGRRHRRLDGSPSPVRTAS